MQHIMALLKVLLVWIALFFIIVLRGKYRTEIKFAPNFFCYFFI